MNQATAAYPGYQGLGGLGYFAGFGQVETRSAWETRLATAGYAIDRALSVASGVPVAAPMLMTAKMRVGQATSLLHAQKAADAWTSEAEATIAEHLKIARQLFDNARGPAGMQGIQFPVAFPDWTITAARLPEAAPGTISPGVIPEPEDAFAPPPDVTPPPLLVPGVERPMWAQLVRSPVVWGAGALLIGALLWKGRG